MKVVQIEQVEANDILSRLDRMESAITALAGAPQSTTTETASEYITRRDVASLFRVTLTTVHDWTRKGILLAYKVGNRVYYKRNEVEAALVQKGGVYARI